MTKNETKARAKEIGFGFLVSWRRFDYNKVFGRTLEEF